MFRRLQITVPRILIWCVSIACYWMLIFFAWWETRVHVFLGAEIFTELSERKGFSTIMGNLEALEKNAWVALADSERLPMIFLLVPLIMALVMFLAPFFVRKDYRGAVKGAFMLPVTAILCYVFASLMNLVIAASVTLGLYVYLMIKPGPDFFMYLVHPLYLLAPPLMKNLPGLASQCVYLLFITSVLTTPGKRRWVATAEPEIDLASPTGQRTVANENHRACILEMDRLCRIIDMKTAEPTLVHSVRADITDYIDKSKNMTELSENGSTAYKTVLFEAAKSLRKTVEEDPERPGARDAFLYVVNEMNHMEFCTPDEYTVMLGWLEKLEKNKPESQEKPREERPVAAEKRDKIDEKSVEQGTEQPEPPAEEETVSDSPDDHSSEEPDLP